MVPRALSYDGITVHWFSFSLVLKKLLCTMLGTSKFSKNLATFYSKNESMPGYTGRERGSAPTIQTWAVLHKHKIGDAAVWELDSCSRSVIHAFGKHACARSLGIR